MNKEILTVVDVVSNEKGVSKNIIFEAIEAALAMATKKRNREDIESRVAIDRGTGNYETFRCWEVMETTDEELEIPSRQIKLKDALEDYPDIEVGQFVEKPMDSVEFGRIAAQIAKQVIVQKVREAERIQVVDAYTNRVGRSRRCHPAADRRSEPYATRCRSRPSPSDWVRCTTRRPPRSGNRLRRRDSGCRHRSVRPSGSDESARA